MSVLRGPAMIGYAAVNLLMSVPMGSSKYGRYYNGLIHGGAVVLILWLAGVVAF